MIRLPSTCFSRRGVASPLTCPIPSEGDLGCVSTPTSVEELVKSDLSSKFSESSVRTNSLRRSRFFLQHETSTVLKDVYEIEERVLGEGGFGTVRRARLKEQGGGPWNRAIKTVKSVTDQIKQEAALMKGLDHPYVCRVFETFEELRCFHVVLELIEGEDLFAYVFSFLSKGQLLEERVAARFTWQILQGLHYCHSQNVIHSDIKPENIMVQIPPEETQIENAHIKIIDFGLATTEISPCPEQGKFQGTFIYAAPEVKLGRRHSSASDLWSAGMVAHVLLLGGLPDREICNSGFPLALVDDPDYAGVSLPAREFLHGLLQSDPRRRLVAARIEMSGGKSWTNSTCESHDSQLRMPAEAQEAFTCFHRSCMLHKAAITAMAMQLLETEQTQSIKEQFIAMDFDGNGCLSKGELSQAIASASLASAAADITSWVELVFDSIDTDGSGEIEYSEYLTAALDEGSYRSDSAIQAAFRVFDIDNSGKVSAREFARVLDVMHDDIVESMGEFDADGDGEINFEEFKNIVAQKSSPQQPLLAHTSEASKRDLDRIPARSTSSGMRRLFRI